MGSIMSAISDDIDEYEALCEKYNEKIRYSVGGPDCYGEHARLLKERQRREWENERATREAARIAALPLQDDVPFIRQ